MCFVVTVMLATCLGLTILGYYQLHRRNHSSLYKKGTCRLPCHMRRQQQQLQLCSRRARFRSEQPKEVLVGQPPNDGAALVFGDLGHWEGIYHLIIIILERICGSNVTNLLTFLFYILADKVEKDLVKTQIELDTVR